MDHEPTAFLDADAFPELLQSPFRRRMSRDVEMPDATCADLHDHQHVNQPERGRCNDKEIGSQDLLRVIPNERRLALFRIRRAMGTRGHVAPDRIATEKVSPVSALGFFHLRN